VANGEVLIELNPNRKYYKRQSPPRH